MELNDRVVLADSRASAVLYRFLMQFDLKKTIIIPVNICSIVPEIINLAGFSVEYVDIQADDLCPDRESILKKLTYKANDYSGILFNYTYGVDLDVEDFYKQIKSLSPELFIIEDKCSCMPSFKYSEICDLTLYSTGYAKQIDIGIGGFGIFSQDFTETLSIQKILNFELDGKDFYVEINKDIDLESYFQTIENARSGIIKHKKELNTLYKNELADDIQLDSKFNDWRFNILVSNKEKILKEIFSVNLFASSHYKLLDHHHENYPVAAFLHSRVINLFNDMYFDQQKALEICKIINKHL